MACREGEEALDPSGPDVCLNSNNHQTLPTVLPANPAAIRPDLSHVDLVHADLTRFDLASFDQDFCQRVVQALDEQGMAPQLDPETDDCLMMGGKCLSSSNSRVLNL